MQELGRRGAGHRRAARRLIGLAAIAALASIAPAQAATPPAPQGGLALTVQSSGAAAKSLSRSGVRLTATKPAKAGPRALTLPLISASIGRTATLAHGGTLVFRKGRRTVVLSRLRTSVGARPRISARIGDELVTAFTLEPAAGKRVRLDAAAGTVDAPKVTVALTGEAARLIRRGLRLRRLSAGTLGTATVTARVTRRVATAPSASAAPGAPAASPAPAGAGSAPARVPGPGAGADPQPDPDPEPVILPAIGQTDWKGSDLDSSNTWKSWITYVYAFGGTVTADRGASRIDPANRYDHRLNVTATSTAPNGDTVVEHQGRVRSAMAAHSIDNRVVDPVITIPAGGTTATLTADGQYGDRVEAGAPPVTYTDEHLLDLDLTGVTPTVDDATGTKTWADVPAVVANEEAAEILGGAQYDRRPWGSFTIRVPADAVTGTSSFAMRASWISYIKNVPVAGTVSAGDGTSHDGNGTFTTTVGGEYDGDASTGTLELPGYMRFEKPTHGIDIKLSDLEIDVAGAASTVTAVVTENGTDEGRKSLATIDLSGPDTTAGTVSWTNQLASFTAEGAAVFTYNAGDEFGKFTLALETE